MGTGSKGGGKSTGGRRGDCGKWDSQGVGGTGGGNLGVKGAGSLQEVGEGSAGSEIPKV